MPDAVWLDSRNRVTVARMVGDDPVMDRQAGRILRSVKRIAARDVDTGNYISKLGIQEVPGELGTGRTVKDRLVVADDEGAGPIEWGHLIRYKNSRRVKWVPAKLYMTRGLAQVKTID